VGKKIDLNHLVGATQIAQRLNVKRPHLIHDWRRRYPEFPKPIVELTGILLWDWREIEYWATKTQRIL
jgi:predicted DNA-binding transcriptional regulator AlpA